MRKSNETASQAIVGFFMLTILLLLGYFTIVISGVDLMTGRSRVRMTVLFSQVGGLKDHDNVMYRGTKVGTVERVEVTPTNLVVIANVDGGVVLRERCRIAVCSLSMLGGNYLQLDEGEGEPMDLAATVFLGETPTDWMRDVAEIARNLNNMTSAVEFHNIVSNIEEVSVKANQFADKVNQFTDDANEVMARVRRGEGTVGRLLSGDESVYGDLRNTVTKASAIADRIERGEGTLGKLLSDDETVYADMRQTMANIRTVAGRLERGEGLLGRFLVEDAALYGEVTNSVVAFRQACASFNLSDKESGARSVVDGANRLLANLNDVAQRLKGGEGTLGRLAASQEMYDEVQALIKDVRQVVDNYRDTTPISTFSSLAIGGF